MTLFTVLLVIIIVLIIFSGTFVSINTEKQGFTILKKLNGEYGEIEIRKYPKMILMQTHTNEDTKESANSSFKLLANYISKGNDKNMKIKMTTPVIYKSHEENKWTLNFIAPKEYNSVNELPKPSNEKISIINEDEKTYIAITFSGNYNENVKNKYLTHLLKYCDDHNIQVNKYRLILWYNPPWTLPFLKRNEILLEITDTKSIQNLENSK